MPELTIESKPDAYRGISRWYDRLFESMNSRLRLLGLRLFMPKADMSILDVGCGTGSHLDVYRRFHCKLYGIDASPSMLNHAKTRLGNDADLRLGDASQMPYQDQSFDLATAMLVLHEMQHSTRLAVLNEMRRVLKENGRMLLIDYQPGPFPLLKGWTTRITIFFAELAAGHKHFSNYRHFLSIHGVPGLIDACSLKIDKQRIVGDGAIGLYLLQK